MVLLFSSTVNYTSPSPAVCYVSRTVENINELTINMANGPLPETYYDQSKVSPACCPEVYCTLGCALVLHPYLKMWRNRVDGVR